MRDHSCHPLVHKTKGRTEVLATHKLSLTLHCFPSPARALSGSSRKPGQPEQTLGDRTVVSYWVDRHTTVRYHPLSADASALSYSLTRQKHYTIHSHCCDYTTNWLSVAQTLKQPQAQSLAHPLTRPPSAQQHPHTHPITHTHTHTNPHPHPHPHPHPPTHTHTHART
jgi:cell division septation protein DedD